MDNELLEPFDRMLADAAPPAVVRAIDGGGEIAGLWDMIAGSGFLDALVAEDMGGAGLSLAEIEPLLRALGARAVPVPVAETMVARALLAEAGAERPDGPIVLATATAAGTGESWTTGAVPLAAAAAHALVEVGDALLLVDLGAEAIEPIGIHGSRAAVLRGSSGEPRARIAVPAGGLRAIAAAIRAAAIAGAGDRLLDLTTAYANERIQFGKPIGRQQAIQQQLAVMAEHAIAARIAAQLGCASGLPVPMRSAATAKAVTSQAVVPLATIAHAVHGAIGISEEYDLQLLTRRLHEWRIADGSESYWGRLLGQARLDSNAITSIDFVRAVA